MKVLLVNPPWSLEEYSPYSKTGAIYPPLGLAYIASALKKLSDIEINILDAFAKRMTLKEYENEIIRYSPDVVGITAYTPTILNVFETVKTTRKILPNSIIILGGPHPTLSPEECLSNKNVDIVVRGEGEITVPILIDALKNKSSFENIDGISFARNGKFIHNKDRAFIHDLDSLSLPSRDLLPMELYRPASGAFKRIPAASMITSRGCPYNCIFCQKSAVGENFRARSPEKVVEEIEHLIRLYKIREITFCDDSFTLNKNRAEKICNLIIDKKLDITWICSTRADLITKPLLDKMKKSGCVSIGYGVESGNSEFLKFINKGINKDEIRNAVKMTKKAGMEVRTSYILGMPGETKKTILETIDFARELNTDFVIFNLAIPLPKTLLYEHAKKEGRLLFEGFELYKRADGAHPLIRLEDVSAEELSELYKYAYKIFYLRIGYIIKRIFYIHSFNDIKRNLKGFSEFLSWKKVNVKKHN